MTRMKCLNTFPTMYAKYPVGELAHDIMRGVLSHVISHLTVEPDKELT